MDRPRLCVGQAWGASISDFVRFEGLRVGGFGGLVVDVAMGLV